MKIPVQPPPILFTMEWQNFTSGTPIRLDEVHIWKIRLSHLAMAKDCLPLLSDNEQKRAARLVVERVRARYVCARAALRMILSFYINQNPGEIRFDYGKLGKPLLSPLFNNIGVLFNLSHSGDMMLTAITQGKELGVDLERNTVVNGKKNILKMSFCENDQINFDQLPERHKDSAFIDAWTHKEAWGKAHGFGLAHPPEMEFIHPAMDQLSAPDQARLTIHADYWLLGMQPARGYFAMVVCLSRVYPQLRFYQSSIRQLLGCRSIHSANYHWENGLIQA